MTRHFCTNPFLIKNGGEREENHSQFSFSIIWEKIPIFQWKGFHIRMSFDHHMTKKLIIIYEMAKEESSVMFPFLLSPPPLILPSFSSIQIIKTVYCPSFKDNFPTIGAYWGYLMIAFLQSKLLHNCTIWYKKRTKIDCWLECVNDCTEKCPFSGWLCRFPFHWIIERANQISFWRNSRGVKIKPSKRC